MDFDAGSFDWGSDSMARGLSGLRAVRRRYLAGAWVPFEYPVRLRPVLRRLARLGFNHASMEG